MTGWPASTDVTPAAAGLDNDLVAHALHALSLFGACTMREATLLLSMWARRDELTDGQTAEVLAYYRPGLPSHCPGLVPLTDPALRDREVGL